MLHKLCYRCWWVIIDFGDARVNNFMIKRNLVKKNCHTLFALNLSLLNCRSKVRQKESWCLKHTQCSPLTCYSTSTVNHTQSSLLKHNPPVMYNLW